MKSGYLQTFIFAAVCCSVLACGAKPAPAPEPADAHAADSAVSDSKLDAGDVDISTADAVTAYYGTAIALSDAAADTAVSDATADIATDAVGDVAAADLEKDAATTKAKTLPLPECAGNADKITESELCANCLTSCLKDEICGNTTTYYNDCDAICKLKAYDGLAQIVPPIDFEPGACPACPACKVWDKFDKFPWCVTLKNGAEVEIQLKCEIQCTDFKPKSATDPAPSATWGPCKSLCSKPPPAGPGCAMTKYKLVCALQDGKTYAGECQMQNCDLQGCNPVGEFKKTAGCTPKLMTKECDGECFDAAKTPNCPAYCDPVCARLKSGYAQSFRNACTAAAGAASVLECSKIVAKPGNLCSADLYAGKGCCGDVDYSIINPICAEQTVNGVTTEYTFLSQKEYDCLTSGVGGWFFKYVGPCV